ncbi:hypothetical protein SOCEGT47_079200 [Sorangium cellulosum]|uniref:DUF883 domain-containing protein n=1 Tax=Sorangium cellulosum TaxID=56 RepID=A0A4P2QDU4_SORCE|nr:hypothetical protein [Sorangium cellulosum]AUX27333.1 hypothetical protein SOCEGT47_079200 [Sorangium cellulosum]
MVVNGNIEQEPGRREGQTSMPAAVPRVLSEVRRADEKLVSLVQERPIATLCAVAAVGYLVGRVVTRLS